MRASLSGAIPRYLETTVIKQQYDNSKMMTPARPIPRDRPRRRASAGCRSRCGDRTWMKDNNVQKRNRENRLKQHIERKKSMHDYRNNDGGQRDRSTLLNSPSFFSFPSLTLLHGPEDEGRSGLPRRRRGKTFF